MVNVTAPELFGLDVGLFVPLNDSVTGTPDGVTVTVICLVSPVDMLKELGDWLRLITLHGVLPKVATQLLDWQAPPMAYHALHSVTP